MSTMQLVTQRWWNVLAQFHEDAEAMAAWKVSTERDVLDEQGPGRVEWLDPMPTVVLADWSHRPWTPADGPVVWWHYRLRHTPTA